MIKFKSLVFVNIQLVHFNCRTNSGSLGFNTSQAHAAEPNQPASVVKQKQQSNNEQTENRENIKQNTQNSQNGQSLSALMKMSNQILVKLI